MTITLRVTLEAGEVNQLPAFWVGQEIDAGRFAWTREIWTGSR